MSSLLLGDPTKSYFKLSLWREAAAWVERISAGDVILFKSKHNLSTHTVMIDVFVQTSNWRPGKEKWLVQQSCFPPFSIFISQKSSCQIKVYTTSYSTISTLQYLSRLPLKSSPFAVKNLIPLASLDGLMQWGRRNYGYLFDNHSLQQKSQSMFAYQYTVLCWFSTR